MVDCEHFENLDPLPRVLQARLTDRLGGSQIEIPLQPRGRAFARLAEAVGNFGAAWVCKKVGPGRLYIPKQWNWQIAQRAEDCRTLYAFGLPAVDISGMYGVSVRSVEGWIKT